MDLPSRTCLFLVAFHSSHPGSMALLPEAKHGIWESSCRFEDFSNVWHLPIWFGTLVITTAYIIFKHLQTLSMMLPELRDKNARNLHSFIRTTLPVFSSKQPQNLEHVVSPHHLYHFCSHFWALFGDSNARDRSRSETSYPVQVQGALALFSAGRCGGSLQISRGFVQKLQDRDPTVSRGFSWIGKCHGLPCLSYLI